MLNLTLQGDEIKCVLDCYKILLHMLNNGKFSNDGIISFDTNFKYLNLSD